MQGEDRKTCNKSPQLESNQGVQSDGVCLPQIIFILFDSFTIYNICKWVSSCPSSSLHHFLYSCTIPSDRNTTDVVYICNLNSATYLLPLETVRSLLELKIKLVYTDWLTDESAELKRLKKFMQQASHYNHVQVFQSLAAAAELTIMIVL